MLTISCYTFHSFVQKFVRLYKKVQVISAWLTFLLSCLCCQCIESGPVTNTSSDRALPSSVGNTLESCGESVSSSYAVVDFTPSTNSEAIIKQKCIEFVKHQAALKDAMMLPNRKSQVILKEWPEVHVHKKLSASRKNLR